MSDLHKDTFIAENCKAELASAISRLDSCSNTLKELLALLEYEEALTVDPRTQQRISTKLTELGIWKKD